jgi:murein peptide amidase A
VARSPHDYRHLVARWREVARESGVRLRPLARVGGFEHFYLRTPALSAEGGIYISAGIHGDEPASSAALISWAEKNVRRLRDLPLLIFPALNPWGLINNCRYDAAGLDLNRLFHRDDQPVINAVKKVVAPCQFRLALMLHEDYDAEGFYLYEIKRKLPFLGEALLEAVSRVMPIESRAKIDGRTAAAGLIRRRFDRARFAKIGYPEAVWLHEFHAERSLTVETPSEFALEQRVRAHEIVLDECLRRVVGS